MFAECVVPEEYGINTKNKRTIGSKMCHALLDKIRYDLTVAKSGSEMGECVCGAVISYLILTTAYVLFVLLLCTSLDMRFLLDKSHVSSNLKPKLKMHNQLTLTHNLCLSLSLCLCVMMYKG